MAPTTDKSLLRKIRIILANPDHLDNVVKEQFHMLRKEWKPNEEPPRGEEAIRNLSVTFVGTSIMVQEILKKLRMNFNVNTVMQWTMQACSTFMLSETDSESVTLEKVQFVVNWVLRCLAEEQIRLSVTDFHCRNFFATREDRRDGKDSFFGHAGYQLTGPMIHGMFGNIWLHAICSKEEAVPSVNVVEPTSVGREFSRKSTRGTFLGEFPGMHERKKNVVYQIHKSLCKVPPELLEQGLQKMVDMIPLPYMLHLREFYEDFENIYLVYDPLGTHAICLLDKVCDDMHHNEDDLEGSIWNENCVIQLVRNFMMMFQQAHQSGFVHGCLRLGNCFLNKKDSLDSMKILEFGLLRLFRFAPAVPPSTLLQPLDEFKSPLPPYVRDFRSIAEMMYTMLGGIPFCSVDFSAEERRLRYYRGAASFAHQAFSKISEPAKHFITELVTPPHLRMGMAEVHFVERLMHQHLTHEKRDEQMKLSPRRNSGQLEKLHSFLADAPKVKNDDQRMAMAPPQQLEAERFMTHPFLEEADHTIDREDASDIIVMRNYGRWRNSLKWQVDLVKVLADRVKFKHIKKIREDLSKHKGPEGKVEWAVFETAVQKVSTIQMDILRRYSKAFGETTGRTIHVEDFTAYMESWRKKRIRELLWEAFAKLRASGLILEERGVHVCERDDLLDALMLRVTNPWSGPASAVEVLFPPDPSTPEDVNAEIDGFLGKDLLCNFLDLAIKAATV